MAHFATRSRFATLTCELALDIAVPVVAATPPFHVKIHIDVIATRAACSPARTRAAEVHGGDRDGEHENDHRGKEHQMCSARRSR